MTGRDRRRELRDAYERAAPEAGVYAIRNRSTGRVLLAASANLAGTRNRFAFARSTGSVGALDGRLADDARAHGLEPFELEVLEVLDVAPTATPAEIRADLAALTELWAEKLAGVPRY